MEPRYEEQLEALKLSEAKRAYVVDRVYPIVRDLLVDTIREMPPDPEAFMREWLRRSASAVVEEQPNPVGGQEDGGMQENGGMQVETCLPGDPLRALSVHYLETGFLEEVAARGLTPASQIYQIEAPVLLARGASLPCPRDGRLGTAYVDAVAGRDLVGKATHMLSYTWGYTVDCVVSSVGAWCRRSRLDPKSTYIWLCCTCINQHRVQEAVARGETVPFEEFASSFGGRVKSIRHVLALMEPWQAPQYCKRVWCVFELNTAVELHPDCKLEIIMPQNEAESFAKAVATGQLRGLWDALARTRLENAQASIPIDRENIFQMVRTGKGFNQLNEAVVGKLQSWFADAAEAHVRQALAGSPSASIAGACGRVAYAFCSLGMLERASALVQTALERLRAVGGLETPAHAAVLSGVALAKRLKGDTDGAGADLAEARRILEATGATDSEEGVAIFVESGHLRRKQEDADGALVWYDKALEVLTRIRALETVEGARLLLCMGHVKREKQDLDGALAVYSAASDVLARLEAGGAPEVEVSEVEEVPEVSELHAALGHVHRLQGDLEAAQCDYAKARRTFEKLGILHTVNGATLLVNIGHVKRAQGDLDGALAIYKEAREAFKAGGADASPEAKECKRLIGLLSL